MKQYSFLFESIGRNLVGASRFSSRKSVAQTIMKQYPQPQMLANKLQQMAEASYGKEKETLLNLSLKCRGLDMYSYPAFAKQISGFSSIWKYIGGAAATAGVAAATKYAIDKGNEYLQNNNPSDVNTSGMFKYIGKNAVNDTDKLSKKVGTSVAKVGDYLKSNPTSNVINTTKKTLNNNIQKYITTPLQNRSKNLYNKEVQKYQQIYHKQQPQIQNPLASPILQKTLNWY